MNLRAGRSRLDKDVFDRISACVNGLAASDYVLVPVMPSKKSMERVPQLLKTLRDLRGRISPQIQPLGLVLNRTHGHTLTALEQDLWKKLQVHCQDQWGSPTPARPTSGRRPRCATANRSSSHPAVPASFRAISRNWSSKSKKGCPVNVDEL